MATMQTRSAPASGLPYFVWEVPGKLISIQLYFDALDRMYPEIMRGLGALKKRGAEVGGILLGRSDSQGKVIVEDFESVPSEYLTGPSYNLSENDLVAFEAALERHRSNAARGLSVVGFYRSHTRDGLFMDDADLAVAQRYFPEAGNVFLIVKPFASRTSIGGFFFWENGEINRESCYLEFPFHRGELGGGEPRPVPVAPPPGIERPLPPYTPAAELRRRPVDFQPEEQAVYPAVRSSLSILSAPPPQTTSRTSGMPRVRWLLVAFLAFVCVAGFFAYQEMSARKPPETNLAVLETTLPLKLSVSEKQNQLDVTWDRNAPAILQAKRGVLSITDGFNKKDLELTGAQLRTGRVLYSRLSADVGLRLEVFGDGSVPVTETIRIVSTEQPQRVPEAARTVPQADIAEKPRKPPVRAAERSKPIARRAPKRAAEPAPKQDAAPPVESPPAEVELQRPARRR